MIKANSCLDDLIKILQSQQDRNASLAAMTDLMNPAFEHRPEVVSYRNLDREELIGIVEQSNDLITSAQAVIKGVSIALYDQDSMFADAIRMLSEVQLEALSQAKSEV